MPDTRHWECPYCLKWSIIRGLDTAAVSLNDNVDNISTVYVKHVVCNNVECRKLVLSVEIVGMVPYGHPNQKAERLGFIRSFSLLPESNAKSQPDYIPAQIVNDYIEAARILNLSPKASATLTRRCLQGMIRDFFGISERNLNIEINKIKSKISEQLWEAIDSVRKIGNIGAHMEADVNIVVDIDPEEASVLIELVEQLFREWYVERHQREKRLESIKKIVAAKAAQKNPPHLDETRDLL